MKEKKFYLETKKEKYLMVFNLNVMEELQEEYGSLDAWAKASENEDGGEPIVKPIKKGLMIMLNEGIDIENEELEEKKPFLTSKQVGRIISEVGLQEVYSKIQETTINSTPEEDGKNE
jgi:hypothetical protein